MKKLDRIDRQILKVLQEDGRISNVALAERVHLSPTPCLERVRRLERDGYITGYRAEVDPRKLDAALLAYVEISLDRTSDDAFRKFRAAVTRMQEVLECHMVAGGFDYLLKVRLKDMEAYRRFLGESLSILPSVRQTHTYAVMEEVKTSTIIPVPPA